MSSLNHDFAQLTSDGSTAGINIPVDGNYSLSAIGSFGAGTLSFEASPDGVNWFVVASFTTNGRESHYISSGEELRATLTGATTPSINGFIR